MNEFKTELENLISRYITDAELFSSIDELLKGFSIEKLEIPESFEDWVDVVEGKLVDTEIAMVEEPPAPVVNKPHQTLGNQSGHRWFDGTSWGTN